MNKNKDQLYTLYIFYFYFFLIILELFWHFILKRECHITFHKIKYYTIPVVIKVTANGQLQGLITASSLFTFTRGENKRDMSHFNLTTNEYKFPTTYGCYGNYV